MIYCVLVTAALLAAWGTSAYMSVCSLAAVFGGRPIVAVCLAAGLELGKLLLVVHLHRSWNRLAVSARAAYSLVVVVLTLLTALEAAGYLMQSHSLDTATLSSDRAALSGLTAREQALRHRIAVIDDTLEQLPHGYVTRRIRERDQAGYDNLQQDLAGILAARQELEVAISNAEAAAGPVIALASLAGLDEADVLLWFVIVLVGVMEPMTIGLSVAASMAWQKQTGRRQKTAGIDATKNGRFAEKQPAENGQNQKTAAAETAEADGQKTAEIAQVPEIKETAKTAETCRAPSGEFGDIVRRHNLTAEKVAGITGRAKLSTVRAWLDGSSEIPEKALRALRKYAQNRPRLSVVARSLAVIIIMAVSVQMTGCAGWTVNGIRTDDFVRADTRQKCKMATGALTSFAVHLAGHVAVLEMTGTHWHMKGINEVLDDRDIDDDLCGWIGRSGFVAQLAVGGLLQISDADRYFVTGYHIGTAAEIWTYPVLHRGDRRHYRVHGDIEMIDSGGGNGPLEWAAYSLAAGALLNIAPDNPCR